LNEISQSRRSRVNDGLADETRGKSRHAFPDFPKSVTCSPLRGVSFASTKRIHAKKKKGSGGVYHRVNFDISGAGCAEFSRAVSCHVRFLRPRDRAQRPDPGAPGRQEECTNKWHGFPPPSLSLSCTAGVCAGVAREGDNIRARVSSCLRARAVRSYGNGVKERSDAVK